MALIPVRGALLLALVAAPLLAQQPIQPPYKTGFAPKSIAGGGVMRGGHPAIGDLGLTPGHKSVAFGTNAHKLYVIEWDGTIAPGFPVTLPSEIVSSPAIANLDGVGQPEVVVGYGSIATQATNPGGVRALHANGTLLWDRPSGDFNTDGQPDPVIDAIAVGDVDGDGGLDVAWGSLDGNVYLVDGATGANKPGFPKYVRDTIFSSPALHDIDGDGKPDIIIGVDAHLEGPPFNTPDGGCVHVIRYDGSEVAGFPQCFDQVIASSPSVGDIDGDGKPEIIFGTGTFYSGRQHRVYALKCDGTAVPGWPVSVDGQVSTSPALGDLDGDGLPDVVVTDDMSSPSTNFHVYAFKGNGTLLWKKAPLNFFGSNPALSAGDPVIGDILGDGNVEVAVPTNTEICVFSKTGTQLTDNGTHGGAFSFYTNGSLSNGEIVEFENDGQKIEVVAVSAASTSPSETTTEVSIWNPKAPTLPVPWGAGRQDPALRTGVVPGTPGCLNGPLKLYTLTPCRVLDTRNANGPLGGPILGAQTSRAFTVTGVCGIPVDAKALSVNLTVTGATANGDFRLFAGNSNAPLASTINFLAGQTRANNAIVAIGAAQISIQNDQTAGAAHAILDVNGFFR